MATRITDIQKDLAKLNAELRRLDQLDKEIARLKAQADRTNATSVALEHLQHQGAANNITFTWTGATTTMSWPAGWIRDRDGTTYSVPAGSQHLSASTYYWAAFNLESREIGFYLTVDKAYSPAKNIVIAQVYTGTGAQSGAAGGGGVDGGGTGISGKTFKQF